VEVRQRFLDAFDVRAVMISRLAPFLSYVSVIFRGKRTRSVMRSAILWDITEQ